MQNCIFTGHCTEQVCNASCPILAQTSYLLERNGIRMNNPVFRMTEIEIQKYAKVLSESNGKLASAIVSNGSFTNVAADALTYCAICEHWKGSQLHCTVYNLKFAQYLDRVQKSWSNYSGESEVDYIELWALNAQVLIISNLDFVNFKDFQSQKLLSLLQARMGADGTTIVVTPALSSLVGEGRFFGLLTDMLSKQKVGDGL